MEEYRYKKVGREPLVKFIIGSCIESPGGSRVIEHFIPRHKILLEIVVDGCQRKIKKFESKAGNVSFPQEEIPSLVDEIRYEIFEGGSDIYRRKRILSSIVPLLRIKAPLRFDDCVVKLLKEVLEYFVFEYLENLVIPESTGCYEPLVVCPEFFPRKNDKLSSERASIYIDIAYRLAFLCKDFEKYKEEALKTTDELFVETYHGTNLLSFVLHVSGINFDILHC